MATDEPAAQKPPGVQSAHAVEPSLSWYLPASHAVHEWARSELAKEPVAHGAGAVEPTEHDAPAGHGSQSS